MLKGEVLTLAIWSLAANIVVSATIITLTERIIAPLTRMFVLRCRANEPGAVLRNENNDFVVEMCWKQKDYNIVGDVEALAILNGLLTAYIMEIKRLTIKIDCIEVVFGVNRKDDNEEEDRTFKCYQIWRMKEILCQIEEDFIVYILRSENTQTHLWPKRLFSLIIKLFSANLSQL